MKSCRPRGTVSDKIQAEARDLVTAHKRYIIHALLCERCDCAADARTLLYLAGTDEDEFMIDVIAGEYTEEPHA